MQVRIEHLKQVAEALSTEHLDQMIKHHKKAYRIQMLWCLWYAFWIAWNIYWTAHYAREYRVGMTVFYGTFLMLWLAIAVSKWSPAWEVKRHDQCLTVLKEVRLGRTE